VTQYKLLIQKRSFRLRKPFRPKYIFCVLDSEKGKFPANFVCNLPRKDLRRSLFAEYFQYPVKAAIELLNAAKEEYLYVAEDILQEINWRLNALKQLTNEKVTRDRLYNRTNR